VNDQTFAISDARIDVTIDDLLRERVGVFSLIVLVGGGLYLKAHGAELPNCHIFRGEPSGLRSILRIAKDASSFSSRGIIQFGLLFPIATPIIRVAFTVISFIIRCDKVYIGVTFIALALLLFSLAAGGR
jgi:uncharacterized membrane protein